MALMVPLTSVRNRTPTSRALLSVVSIRLGVAAAFQIEHGHTAAVIVTVTPADGVSMLPLLSVARLPSTVVPAAPGVHVYVQEVVPDAACQVVPPSVETWTEVT